MAAAALIMIRRQLKSQTWWWDHMPPLEEVETYLNQNYRVNSLNNKEPNYTLQPMIDKKECVTLWRINRLCQERSTGTAQAVPNFLNNQPSHIMGARLITCRIILVREALVYHLKVHKLTCAGRSIQFRKGNLSGRKSIIRHRNQTIREACSRRASNQKIRYSKI